MPSESIRSGENLTDADYAKFCERLKFNFRLDEPDETAMRNMQLATIIFRKCTDKRVSRRDFWSAAERFFETNYNPNWVEADFMRNVQKTEVTRTLVPVWYAELPQGAEFVWRGESAYKETDVLFFVIKDGYKRYYQVSILKGLYEN